MNDSPLARPRAGERLVRFQVDGSDYELTVPTDMSALRIIRDLAGHPRPDWQCEFGVCGRCESVVNGAPTRLCSVGHKRLADAEVATPEPTRTAEQGRR